MTASGLRAALISTDAGFREQIRDICVDAAMGVVVGLEIAGALRRLR